MLFCFFFIHIFFLYFFYFLFVFYSFVPSDIILFLGSFVTFSLIIFLSTFLPSTEVISYVISFVPFSPFCVTSSCPFSSDESSFLTVSNSIFSVFVSVF